MLKVLVGLALFIFLCASSWKMHDKAGQPGWVGVVTVLRTLGKLKMITRPYWWIFLYLVPGVNVVIDFIVTLAVARTFRKGFLFGVGMFFFPMVFIPMVGFGEARYQRPVR
jgi:hypothetical protein